MKPIPKKIQDDIEKLVTAMKSTLAANNDIPAILFAGQFDGGLIPLPLDLKNETTTRISLAFVRAFAKELKPDYVILMTEGYAFPDTLSNEEKAAAMAQYKNLSDCPNREEVICLSVETIDGYWLATNSKTSDLKFDFKETSIMQGRFTNFLHPEPTTH